MACNFHCVSGQNGVRLLKTLLRACLVKMRHENENNHLPVAHAVEGNKSHWKAWKRLAEKSLGGVSSVSLKIITLEWEETKIPSFRERLCCQQQ